MDGPSTCLLTCLNTMPHYDQPFPPLTMKNCLQTEAVTSMSLFIKFSPCLVSTLDKTNQNKSLKDKKFFPHQI